MYTKSVRIYDLLYGFKDYAAASAEVRDTLERCGPPGPRLLDVACGTGRHLEHLRAWYEVEGMDISEPLLEVARERCPGVRLHTADMADFDLPGSYDVITCLFSSIAYVKTVDRLRSTMASVRRHLAPGGILLLEPWFTPETFWTGTITANFVDEPDTKIAWMYTSNPPEDQLAVLNIHYLMGTPQGVEHFTERHELGLFSDEEYRAAIEDAGLNVDYQAKGPFGRGLFIGRDVMGVRPGG